MQRLLPIFLLALPVLAQEGQDPEQKVEPPLTSGRPIPAEQSCFDVLHYGLSLKVDPQTESIDGSVSMKAHLLTASETLILDLDDHLTAKTVELLAANSTQLESALPLPFTHQAGEIKIDVSAAFNATGVKVGDTFELRVAYGGQPRRAPRPPWDGGFQWSKTEDGSPWIATSCQMQGADLWWPCKDQPGDEPETTDLFITVPKGLICASNGALKETKTSKGWTTFHWHVSTPINTYGIALNIAPYEKLSRRIKSITGERFEVSFWVLPENKKKGEVLFEDLVRQLHWFEDTYGPYPFRADKCGVAETPHLGMEHQSITAYGGSYNGNPWGADQGFDFLLHHELSHEWWANLVTCRNWTDFWIHESFATYAQALYTEHLNGKQAYRDRMAEIRRGLRNQGPIAARKPMSSTDVYFGAAGGDIYNKGAWALHTLRWLVNDDETFFRTLRRMAYPDPALEATSDGSACRFTDTEEIRSIAEEQTGLDLGWFFEVYLRQAALPRLVQRQEGNQLFLSWTHPDLPDLVFPMPIEALVDGKLQRIEMSGGEGLLDVKGAKEVELDPQHWILKE